MRFVRLQSAMEYLMTYGWSILLIAIVLAALFALGVFNSGNLSPRVQPGSCMVFRPNGVGTTKNINLEGTCSGELPEYVGYFGGSAYLSTGSSTGSLGNLQYPFTVTVWMQTPLAGQMILSQANGVGAQGWYLYVIGGAPPTSLEVGYYNGSGGRTYIQKGGSPYLSDGNWHFISVTYYSVGSSVTEYIDGKQLTSLSVNGNSLQASVANTMAFVVGKNFGTGQTFTGDIADVAVYNSSLDSASVAALYQEGIGGAPIDLQNLVGWWPLNGNGNDYSGDYNNGVTTGVVFTSSWENGYTP